MKSLDIQELLINRSGEPCFFVEFFNLGRGLVGDKVNDGKPYIKHTKTIHCWRIVDDNLQDIDIKTGIFDTDTYIIQWIFELVVGDTVKEESLFYYWKGDNAYKGYSPLPLQIQNQDTIVERIRQWSEPALFFHMFAKPLVVFSGKREDFSPEINRLFIVRGELESEIHLFEVPCLKESLRSRSPFLLIEPSISTIFIWNGASVPEKHRELISEKLKQSDFKNSWRHFKQVEVKEGQDDKFFEALGSEGGNYVAVKNSIDFVPRLFYLNSVTGDFLATEVVYPLRSKEYVAAFPFLQSHLYTANQPAFFLLDNNNEIWLWEGWFTPESNLELYNNELQLAKEAAINYSKEKEKLNSFTIPVRHIFAGLEPTDFINAFPTWNKRDDITDIQLKEGRTTDVNIIEK